MLLLVMKHVRFWQAIDLGAYQSTCSNVFFLSRSTDI